MYCSVVLCTTTNENTVTLYSLSITLCSLPSSYCLCLLVYSLLNIKVQFILFADKYSLYFVAPCSAFISYSPCIVLCFEFDCLLIRHIAVCYTCLTQPVSPNRSSIVLMSLPYHPTTSTSLILSLSFAAAQWIF